MSCEQKSAVENPQQAMTTIRVVAHATAEVVWDNAEVEVDVLAGADDETIREAVVQALKRRPALEWEWPADPDVHSWEIAEDVE